MTYNVFSGTLNPTHFTSLETLNSPVYSVPPCICPKIKAHGLHGRTLWEVTWAALRAHVTYASPSWSAFVKCDETGYSKTESNTV